MRKLRRIILTIGVCLLLAPSCVVSSCAPPSLRLSSPSFPEIDVNVYVSNAFSDEEHRTIVDGIMMWDKATRGMITWRIMPFNGYDTPAPDSDVLHRLSVVFRRTTSDVAWVKEWDKGNKNVLYGLCRGNEVWLVQDRLKSRVVKTIIAAHEFGHALGLSHVEDKASVMSQFYRTSIMCLTAGDLREFCDRYMCIDDDIEPVCTPSDS